MSKIQEEHDGIIRYKDVCTKEEREYKEALNLLRDARDCIDMYDQRDVLRALVIVTLGPPNLRFVYEHT